MFRDGMRHAATDGWCADWARVTTAPKTIFVQHVCEDHDEDTVHLEHHEISTNLVEDAAPGGFRRH